MKKLKTKTMDNQYQSLVGQKKSVMSCNLKLCKRGGVVRNQVI